MDYIYNLEYELCIQFPVIISKVGLLFLFHWPYSFLFISSFELSEHILGPFSSSVLVSSSESHIGLSCHFPLVFSGQ